MPELPSHLYPIDHRIVTVLRSHPAGALARGRICALLKDDASHKAVLAALARLISMGLVIPIAMLDCPVCGTNYGPINDPRSDHPKRCTTRTHQHRACNTDIVIRTRYQLQAQPSTQAS